MQQMLQVSITVIISISVDTRPHNQVLHSSSRTEKTVFLGC